MDVKDVILRAVAILAKNRIKPHALLEARVPIVKFNHYGFSCE